MGFTYHFGIRQIVLEDAPVFNGNAIEDAIIGIQSHYELPKFNVRELFYPNEQTCGGTSGSVFVCEWFGSTAQGNSSRLPPGLAEQAEKFMSESWSEPYRIELPGSCDILVPNLPRIDESLMMNHLKHTCELREFSEGSHLKVFGKEKVTMGSLDAEVEVIELQLEEGVFSEENSESVKRVLENLKVAQQYSLFVTFGY